VRKLLGSAVDEWEGFMDWKVCYVHNMA
jgi:hypothetical protein